VLGDFDDGIGEDLDGDVSVELRVARAIDPPHAAIPGEM
jgi:hypothetical protein